MNSVPIRKKTVISKQMAKAIQKAEREMQLEGEKQLDIVMCSSILALYRYWGWKTERLSKLIELQQTVFDEVSNDQDKSVLKLLDEECNIELTNHEGVSYRDVIYLNSEIDDGKPLTAYQWLNMRQNQKKWIECQLMAGVFLAMHRKEGWGAKRVKELLDHMQDIKAEYDYDREKLIAAVLKEANYDWAKQRDENV